MDTLITIACAVQAQGGRALLVGGAVRDSLLGLTPKDWDTEVYGLPAGQLAELLAQFGRVDAVGVSFGVLKLHTPAGEEFDFSLPRTESKAAPGHRGFLVTPDHTLSIYRAAARRDYTVNSLAQDPLTGELFDPYGGRRDLADRLLRATSAAYLDDPLRPLRGLALAGRLGLTCAHPGTRLLAELAGAEYGTLAPERIAGEWLKWAARSRHPSHGLRFLQAAGWLPFYPALAALVGCPQDAAFHPEGDVWTHTLLAVDEAARLTADWPGERRAAVLLAALLHDAGKPRTTVTDPAAGAVRSPGHAAAGELAAAEFLAAVQLPGAAAAWRRVSGAEPGRPAATLAERVLALVREHMAHLNDVTPRTVRRLADRLWPATISELLVVIAADHRARPPLPGGLPERAAAIRAEADRQALADAAPADILTGRQLLAAGLIGPGPAMGRLLAAARQAQLDGAFHDAAGALAWARTYLTLA